MNIDAKTRITGLFGYPVEHSLSPDMHNSAFELLGLNFCYVALPVHPDSLNRAVEGIRSMNFRGVNVTVPHKENVLYMIEEIDPEAQFIGAVNTIVNDNEKLTGYNTDGRGFIRSLEENNIRYEGKNIFVIGTGGASRAVCYYLCQKAENTHLFDIDTEKAKALVNDLRSLNSSVYLETNTEKINNSDIIINATPLGLKQEDPLPIDAGILKPEQVVIDLIYKDTPLLRSASSKGCTVLNGLGMLLWQGAIAFELWTGSPAPIDTMRDALLHGFAKKE
jgi:shikimate dehydrogenase